MTEPETVNDGDAMSNPVSSDPKSDLFQCQQCKLTFGRIDHLKRHVKLHTDSSQYMCVCGSLFSRNDIFARHLRQCERVKADATRVPKPSGQPSRAKSACDRCASAKTKCDSQQPCLNCKRKSLSCAYTRRGYADPYDSFRVGPRTEVPAATRDQQDLARSTSFTENETGSTQSGKDSMKNNAPTHLNLEPVEPQDLQMTGAEFDFNVLETAPTNDYLPFPQMSFSNVHDMMYMPVDFEFDPMGDFTFEANEPSFQLDRIEASQSALPDGPLHPELPKQPNASGIYNRPPGRVSGLPLAQLDPVEAKGLEVRGLLSGSELLAEDTISTYITRTTLVLCADLFITHFQPNVPIVHMPTFQLVATSPVLLLAIMLVGACYAEEVIPVAVRFNLASELLRIIENQPHETRMETPPLSTIQASVILRPVLVCSRNETASKFAALNFARTISMAERAKVFDPVPPFDYTGLTVNEFDWTEWIERETRKRVACQIFCQDMALCVFRRTSPSLSPMTFDVQLPSYESCWEADSKSKCLHQLQSLPTQVRVSEAMHYIGSDIGENLPVIEASSFGMFILILSLHCLLFQATENYLETFSNTTTSPGSSQVVDSLSHLGEDFSGNRIAALADYLVSQHGSSNISTINRFLNRWHRVWESRGIRDTTHENRTFNGDPIQFWWLAKLYLVLHFYKHDISEDNEFAILVRKRKSQETLIDVQTKVVEWLIRFRKQRDDPPLSPEHYLSQFLKPAGNA